MIMIKDLSSSTNIYHHLTFSPLLLSSSSSSLLLLDKINLISVNREIHQDLQLIVDNYDEVNINCQLSGTETGLSDLRQTQLTSTEKTTSPLPPPSLFSPPPLISPSSSSSSSTSLNCLPPPTSPKLKTSSSQSTTTKSTLKGFIENTEAVVSSHHDDDDKNDDDCGCTGYRNYRKIIISRGSRYSSCKEAVRLDDDKRDDDDERAETAPIRNQSEEESYIRSELEKSCKADQFALNHFTVTSSSKSSSSSTNSLPSELKQPSLTSTTTLSPPTISSIKSTVNSTSEQTVSPLTQETTTRGKGEQLNSDCNYYINELKDEINPPIDDTNLISYGSLVSSSFNINCDDQSEQTDCQPNNNNNQQQQQQQHNQLFLLTCLPIQPTVNVYNQLNVNKINNSYVNSRYANHNKSNDLNASELISPSSDCTTTLLTLNEVNYDSVDSRLATSNHQHNQQFNQINLPDWTSTTKTETSETVNGNNLTNSNNTRVDKFVNFSSLLLQSSSPVTTLLLSPSPRGLSSTHHLPNHPFILSLYFQHLHNSTTIVDNLINQIVPGLFNYNINYYHDNNNYGELVKPYESDYLDFSTPKLLQLHSISTSPSSHVVTIDDDIENNDCLLINNHHQSFFNNSNLINSENSQTLIDSQYSSKTQAIHLQSSSLQLINNLSVINGNSNIVLPLIQSVLTNQQSTKILNQSSSQSSLTNCNYVYDNYLTNQKSHHLKRNSYIKEDTVVDKEITMSLYKTSNGHKKSTSSSSSTSTALLNNLTHHSPSDDEEDEDEEEYIVDDDELGSTSSDESFPPPVLPGHSLGGIYGGFGGGGGGSTSGVINNNYGNPLAYSLHTIIEESCEESESESLLSRISDNADNQQHVNHHNNSKSQNNLNGMLIPPSPESSTNSLSTHHHHLNYHDDDPGDPQNYTAFQIGHNVMTTNGNTSGHHHHSQGSKRGGGGHVSFSKDFQPTGDYSDEEEEEVDDEGSDNMSETSETLADFGDEDDDLDPITLASSRLEKYFTSGLLGSGAYDYPDDVEFQDDDDPNDLYNQATKTNTKVEIKVNNKNVINNNQPQQSSDNQDNISNGISMISEESNVIKLTSSSPTTITTVSSSSSPPPTLTTLTVDTQLSKQSTTTTKIIHHNVKSEDYLKEEDNLIKEDDDYFINKIKSIQHNGNFNCDHVKTEIKESESKSTTKVTSNKETNQSQIVNKIVITDDDDDEQQSKQQLVDHLPSNITNNQPTIDNSSSNFPSKRKKEVTTIMSIINSDNDDDDNTNHQKDNVNHHQSPVSSNVDSVVSRKTVQSVTRSIQVKPPAPQPPTNQIDSLINRENNKSSSSLSSNVAINTNSSSSRTDFNQLFSSPTKSNQSDEKINSVSSVRKESTSTTTINKPSVETTIRFGPSPQLVRSLLADEKSSTRRLITNRRKLIGGSEPCPSNESTSAVPHISVSDYSESFSHRGSIGSSGGDDIFTATEDDVDKAFAFHNRSQTSLSSFGVRSESLSSVYSAAGGGRYGTVTISGEILFSLVYKQSESSLELYIKECRNLAPVDSKRNRSDPYVKLYLLPDRSKSGKRKTKVKKHTLNPIFDENLKFYLPVNQLDGRTLWISVWHSDIFGRNDFLGEVTLTLTKDILRNSGLRWYPLQERIDQIESNPVNYKGGIFIALKFVPTGANKGPSKPIGVPGKLLVMVKEAHNLMPTRSNGTSDPFVKCYLLPDKSKKLKTPVIKKTVNPRWNHTFEVTDITTNDLQTRCLELTIWDYDKLTSNDFLGGVRLSLGQGIFEGKPVDWLDSTEQETTLWKQLLDKTDLWVYGELPLRTSLQSRTYFGR